MENKGFDNLEKLTPSAIVSAPAASPVAIDGDDSPPAYPQNPTHFEGYGNIGFCNPEQGFHSTLYYSYVIHESN